MKKGKNEETMSDNFQSQFADVNGVRLHYVSVGQGKLLMFVHGFPEFWKDLTVKHILDGSHWVVHEQPELVNSLIRGLVARDAV
jgi:pimeloyl-ACP methyl ester carboxylesterase